KDHYINLGYTDGMVEFADREAVVKRIVYWIRKLKPTTMIAFDPGWGYQKWHKSDHRSASYLAADAARAAEWRLVFPGQIVQEGMEAHQTTAYLPFSQPEERPDTQVHSSDYSEQKAQSLSKYISQFTSGWENCRGPDLADLPGNEGQESLERLRKRVFEKDTRN